MGTTDKDALRMLAGNPYAESPALIDDVSSPAAVLRDGLLAVAFELRTANLIAVAEGGSVWEAVHARLGVD
jgi:hypothetical protein